MEKGIAFGKLITTGISKTKRFPSGALVWYDECVCECGVTKFSQRGSLKRGTTKSCGCESKKQAHHMKKANTTHGMTGTKIHNVFRSLQNRCRNKNVSCYHNYGGRGIKCLWSNFIEFYKDMGKTYHKHYQLHGGDTTIERIDVNGNYCKDNCRWATSKEQASNTRRNRLINYRGETKLISTRCEELNIPLSTVRNRLIAGKTIEQAFKKKRQGK